LLKRSGFDPSNLLTGFDFRCAHAHSSFHHAADKSNADIALSWSPVAEATEYDVVRGDLMTLRLDGGNFTTAVQSCEADNHGSTSLTVSGTPSPGNGYWYLVRGRNCGGNGTYDSAGSSQAGLRDAEIAASGNDCP
jgi:hypothetical protein